MADLAGRSGLLAISTDGGSTYNSIGGVKEITMTVDQETYDVTDHDSGAWMEHIVGRHTVTMSATLNYDEANTYQEALLATGLMSGTMCYFRYRPNTSSGVAKEYYGQGSVTSVEISSPNDGPAEISLDLQVTGALTRGTQA